MNSDEVEDTSIVETDNESDVVIDSSVTTNAWGEEKKKAHSNVSGPWFYKKFISPFL